MAVNLTKGLLKPGNYRLVRGILGTSGTISQQQKKSFYDYAQEPFYPLPNRVPRWQTVEEAVSVIKSNDNVFVHGGAATPITLVNAMTEYAAENSLSNIKLFHIHTEGKALYARPEYEGIFRSNSFFIGANCREPINSGRADFTPIFLSEIPLLFRRNIINLDVALIQVSQPDNHGFCTLGPSVDCTRAAIQNARYIIGLVNPQMPRTFGDGIIHKSHFDALCEDDFSLPEHPTHALSDAEKAIGRYIAENLVEDGATLQMGIGSIPDAVLNQLYNHQNLGIHSEMFSDGILDLVKSGAVTNAHKKVHQGKIVGGFCVGTRRLFDFLDDNPFIVMCDIAFVNNTAVISQNPRVTAINSCIEVDLTGQVVADSIGTRMYSGVGGQVDFIRGAALGLDGRGKPIIALPSTTKKGDSKIVPFLKEGGGIVTTRAHVHYIVTEYGIAYLFGKNLRQRAHALINIAHPDHREELERAAFERLKCMPSAD
ncbi:succinyl-CoA:acetate/propanoyl-CoA:succinate CoA transferase-like [Ptychodera flava]|uniref:succinyl-CoA:acetate/propanoyl-CoA:succinate CoA transferase-like n=1 Tax=Ptychodera flava TaxID=63121 RepID=UPI003969F13F